MKKKTIASILTKKFNDFLSSITDEKLKAEVRKNAIISGGCITSMFLGEKINDFDIYFKDEDTVLKLATYYVMMFNKIKNSSLTVSQLPNPKDGSKLLTIKGVENQAVETAEEAILEDIDSNGEALLDQVKRIIGDSKVPNLDNVKTAGETIAETLKYKPLFVSDNAISLTGDIQLILRFYGDPEEIHKNYDFVHATNYWTYKKGLVLNKEALTAILSRELIYIGSKYPVSSIIRTRKFISRGWTINAGQMLKMILQASTLNLEDPAVLREQLIGVDVFYFNIIIGIIEKYVKDAQKKGEIVDKIGYSLISSLIDKVF